MARLPIAHRAPCPSVAVLVAGGFHTTQLCNLLREKNVSYIVMTPTVDQFTELDHELYVKRLNGVLLSNEEILEAALSGSKTSGWTAWAQGPGRPEEPGRRIFGRAPPQMIRFYLLRRAAAARGSREKRWTAIIQKYMEGYKAALGAEGFRARGQAILAAFREARNAIVDLTPLSRASAASRKTVARANLILGVVLRKGEELTGHFLGRAVRRSPGFVLFARDPAAAAGVAGLVEQFSILRSLAADPSITPEALATEFFSDFVGDAGLKAFRTMLARDPALARKLNGQLASALRDRANQTGVDPRVKAGLEAVAKRVESLLENPAPAPQSSVERAGFGLGLLKRAAAFLLAPAAMFGAQGLGNGVVHLESNDVLGLIVQEAHKFDPSNPLFQGSADPNVWADRAASLLPIKDAQHIVAGTNLDLSPLHLNAAAINHLSGMHMVRDLASPHVFTPFTQSPAPVTFDQIKDLPIHHISPIIPKIEYAPTRELARRARWLDP